MSREYSVFVNISYSVDKAAKVRDKVHTLVVQLLIDKKESED